MYKCCYFTATWMHFVHGEPLNMMLTNRIIFSDNKKSRLENSYTQKHKHKYLNFQLAIRVISVPYISRKLDKVIFGTVTLPNTPPLSASFVCQVPKVAWHSLCNEHFLPHYRPIHCVDNSRRETKHGDRGKRIILDLGEKPWATCAKREAQHFYENPNANTDWNMTWRLKTSTRVINTRAQTDVWPLILKGTDEVFFSNGEREWKIDIFLIGTAK